MHLVGIIIGRHFMSFFVTSVFSWITINSPILCNSLNKISFLSNWFLFILVSQHH